RDVPRAVDPPGIPHSQLVARVDEDKDGKMLAAAIEQHKANRDIFELISHGKYRDSVDSATGKPLYKEGSPSTYIKEMDSSGVAIYHGAGWFDLFTRDTLLWMKNLHIPQKAMVGPWFHTTAQGLDLTAEHLRWYDYWLKGIKNGVMDEEPLHYWTLGAPPSQEWQAASQWPLPNERTVSFYFHPGPSGSIKSVNDGAL